MIYLIPEYVHFFSKNKQKQVPTMESDDIIYELLNNIVFPSCHEDMAWKDNSFLKYSGIIKMKGLNGSSLQIDCTNLTQSRKLLKPQV